MTIEMQIMYWIGYIVVILLAFCLITVLCWWPFQIFWKHVPAFRFACIVWAYKNTGKTFDTLHMPSGKVYKIERIK